MLEQLRLWELPNVGDLAAKIRAEKEAGLTVHYHFLGVPIDFTPKMPWWVHTS